MPKSNPRHLVIVSDPPSGPGAAAPSEDELMLVGELARATGKTVRAIHLYEDLGLLRPQDRSKGRYRLFGPDAVMRVRWITKLQSLGLSLSQIQEVAREQEDSSSAMFAAAKLRKVYLGKLSETQKKIEELLQLQAELSESLNYLATCDSRCEPEVPTEGCSSCDRHPVAGQLPELVAGAQAK
jgi:DNA-binding transcriptional MerR regulator